MQLLLQNTYLLFEILFSIFYYNVKNIQNNLYLKHT